MSTYFLNPQLQKLWLTDAGHSVAPAGEAATAQEQSVLTTCHVVESGYKDLSYTNELPKFLSLQHKLQGFLLP